MHQVKDLEKHRDTINKLLNPFSSPYQFANLYKILDDANFYPDIKDLLVKGMSTMVSRPAVTKDPMGNIAATNGFVAHRI